MRTIKEALAFNIKRLRGNRTQEQMAEFLGVNVRTYQRLEKGTRPQGATMARVLAKLKVPEVTLVQLPGVGAPEAPGPSVQALAGVIQDQERQLAAQRVQIDELTAANKKLTAQAETTSNLGGSISQEEVELVIAYRNLKEQRYRDDVRLKLDLEPIEKTPELDPDPPKDRPKSRKPRV